MSARIVSERFLLEVTRLCRVFFCYLIELTFFPDFLRMYAAVIPSVVWLLISTQN